ncbi:MAG: RidA family protein [Rhodospirillaceae bacterium]|nr:RidA family protein [Rhodospirillaceae bacterium]MBT6204510.1 RidA family protein [Rhodospirillaceae bacterium]MBT6509146.1 RidA family protein [Rhodospirillaceae bacterium]MBT7612344.1 RidA family protein [Rhodospirillaceae bacterium]
MLDIRRVAGGAQGRTAGSSYNGFAWAVATSTDDVPDIHAQTLNALLVIDGILADLGTDKTRLINVTVYLARMRDKVEMDRAWVAWISDDPAHWPQRACVEAGLAGYNLVEMVVIAAAPE